MQMKVEHIKIKITVTKLIFLKYIYIFLNPVCLCTQKQIPPSMPETFQPVHTPKFTQKLKILNRK
jgi:hypothetical protein